MRTELVASDSNMLRNTNTQEISNSAPATINPSSTNRMREWPE